MIGLERRLQGRIRTFRSACAAVVQPAQNVCVLRFGASRIQLLSCLPSMTEAFLISCLHVKERLLDGAYARDAAIAARCEVNKGCCSFSEGL